MKKPMTTEQIKARLAEIDADERFHYKCANIQINAPLALVQLTLEVEAQVLAQVIGVEGPRPGPREVKS